MCSRAAFFNSCWWNLQIISSSSDFSTLNDVIQHQEEVQIIGANHMFNRIFGKDYCVESLMQLRSNSFQILGQKIVLKVW